MNPAKKLSIETEDINTIHQKEPEISEIGDRRIDGVIKLLIIMLLTYVIIFM